MAQVANNTTVRIPTEDIGDPLENTQGVAVTTDGADNDALTARQAGDTHDRVRIVADGAPGSANESAHIALGPGNVEPDTGLSVLVFGGQRYLVVGLAPQGLTSQTVLGSDSIRSGAAFIGTNGISPRGTTDRLTLFTHDVLRGIDFRIGALGAAVKTSVRNDGLHADTLKPETAGADLVLQTDAVGDAIALRNGVEEAARFDAGAASVEGETGMFLRYHAAAGVVVNQVEVGPMDSAGAGYRYLRVPNGPV